MAYYGRRYRSWRSRGWSNSSAPSKYTVLTDLFGEAVAKIRREFLNLDENARDELLSDYGAIYGTSAENYARKTFAKWKQGETKLSGQTMERLIELVPPYLSPDQRFSVLQLVLKAHKKYGEWRRTIKINIKEPAQGFAELQEVLASMTHDDVLAHLPDKVMKAANWLYDDDITAARAMLAQAERIENDLVRSRAIQEIELLRRTISTGQVKSASYSVEMPAGKLSVVAYKPSLCFIATVCYGHDAPETVLLRQWRDCYLIEKEWGRKFIVWYYHHGQSLAALATRFRVVKFIAKFCIGGAVNIISRTSWSKHER
jgi:hypothetical protein